MLEAVEATAGATLGLVEGIRAQMAGAKHRLRSEMPRLYSQGLINTLFRHPYPRIDVLARELVITRQTAAKYLDTLAAHDFLTKHQAGRSNYYVNDALVGLFLEGGEGV